jgi:hypothetical protein
MVKRMLIRRSQEQPVMIAAAAGGKRMATYRNGPNQTQVSQSQARIILTKMRITSELLTIVDEGK